MTHKLCSFFKSNSILICTVRLTIDAARPKAAALNLFHIGPGLQRALETYNLSAAKPLTLALAIADFNIFIKYSFGLLFKCSKMLCATNSIFAANKI